MKQIDHDPNEFKRDGTWPLAGLFLAVLWAGFLYTQTFDWYSFALGGLTIGLLVAWAIDVTGNKVPESWRSKPPSR